MPDSLRRLLANVPARHRWAQLPTPVQRASWLDVGPTKVWIKRDDLSSPIYGGGKVRKLEWVLANPPYDDSRPVLSVGGIGSHHLLALALFLQTLDRPLHALTFEQVMTEHVRRNLAVLLGTGARLWHVRSRARLPLAMLAYHGWRRPRPMGRFMAAGASTALGCFGFVEAGLELAAQIRGDEMPPPDTVFVAAGSAGTAAGLALGLSLAGLGPRLHLVSSVEPLLFNELLFRAKIREAYKALRRFGLRDAPRSASALLRRAGVRWTIDHRQVGGGYGVPTEAAAEAIAVAGEHGIVLEPTYTGKCLAALRQGSSSAGERVLFWHTHAANDLQPLVQPGWEASAPFPIPGA